MRCSWSNGFIGSMSKLQVSSKFGINHIVLLREPVENLALGSDHRRSPVSHRLRFQFSLQRLMSKSAFPNFGVKIIGYGVPLFLRG
jgi:hypothetical protein